MNKTLAAIATALLLLGRCANWQRNFYEGMRASSTQASLRPPPHAVPAASMPSFDRYRQEREQLQRSPE